MLLAALTTKEPLLLIGRHGTAKSFLLERLAQALGLVYRFYNASLINYDDLVGIPLPDETQTSLRYITTPTAIWDAEVVFVDELNRTRPDLQNKLFPIIHERRVQGVELEKLRYRWAAMNPAANGDHDNEEQYLGAEPLDPALADRFGFLIEVPDWSDLSEAERTEVLLDQFRGPHEFPVQVPALVERSTAIFRELCARPPAQLCGYFLALESQLRGAGTRFSSRRMTTLLRTSLGIHASRIALCIESGEKSPKPEWQESLFLALAHGHPGLASGPVDRGALLALHRQAWNIAGLNEDDPWKELLKIADPVERAAVASKTGFPLTEADLSSVILEAVASRPTEAQRAAIALVLYLALRSSRRIAATAAETLASQLSRVLRPFTTTHQVYGKELQRCREVASLCSGLERYASRQVHAQSAQRLPAGWLCGYHPAGVARRVHRALGALRCRDRRRKERIVSMLLHNMSAPPRTEVRAEKRGIADRIVVFSLVYALIVRGVLEARERPEKLPKGKEFQDLRRIAPPTCASRFARAGHHLATFSPESASPSLSR